MSRRRIALIYFGIAATVLIATYVVLQEFGVSRTFVENMLAKVIVRERFRLGNANLDLREGTLTLDQFRITSRDDPSVRPLVKVEEIEVGVDTNPLGSVRIHQIKLKGLHLDLDLSRGAAPDLGQILAQGGESGEATAGPPPAILVENSRVTLHFSPDAEPIDFSDVALRALPEEPGSARMVLTGSMTSPAGLATEIRGSGDFAKNQFRAMLEIVDFPLDPSLASRFAPAIGDVLEAADLRGRARRLVIWIEYDDHRADGEDGLVAGATLDLGELHGVPPVVPYRLVDATARVTATTRDEGSVRFTLDDEDIGGNVHARGVLTHCFTDALAVEAEIEATGMLIGPELRGALCKVEEIERIWNAFEATAGRVDAVVQLRSDSGSRKPKAELDLVLAGVTANWNGFPDAAGLRRIDFPEPIENIHGRIHLRNQEVRIDGLELETCGAGARIDGSVGTRRGDHLAVVVETPDVELGERLLAGITALVPEAPQHWAEYAPSGRAAARVQVTGTSGGSTDVRVAFRPLGASASYAGFPYRLEQIRGLIEIEPDGVSFDLVGRRGETRANVHGRFRRGAGADDPLRSELWVHADAVPLDRTLGEALATLSPQLEQTWEFLAPGGAADCELSLWREPGSAHPSYDVRVDARGADVQLETFAVPIRAIEGPIFVLGDGDRTRVDIGVVHGLIDNDAGVEPAELTCHGTVRTAPDDTSMDIVSTVAGLQLVDRLRDALDASGAFSGETWDVIRPSGLVDLVARQSREPGATAISHELSIELDGVASDAEMLPKPARNIRGEVVVRDGEARFAQLRGKVGGSDVHLSQGLARHDADRSRLEVTVACEDFPVDDDLANLFTGPIKQTYLDRRFSGRLTVNRLDLEFDFPDDADSFSLEFGGRFSVRDLDLTLGTEFEDVVGLWRITEGIVDAAGGSVAGTVESCGLTTVGHRINGAQMQFRADHDSVELRGMRGRLHNGTLFGLGGEEADLVYEFGDTGRLAARIGWSDVSLSELLAASGVSAGDYRGNLSGELRLDELVDRDIVNARGRGRLAISEGRLGEVPVFTAIYSYLAPRRRPRFDAIAVDFAFGDQRIEIGDVDIHSPLLSVSGKGSVAMDGYIDMELDFADLFGRDADWLVLPQLARFLTTGVVRFQVYGYVRDPQARPQWLWESKADRVELGPIPARDRG